MFEKASKQKLRIASDRGLLTTEDLWDLDLIQLNSIAKKMNRELKNANEEDFLEVENKENTVLKLAFDIVIHILNVKKEELKNKKERAEKKLKKEKILELLAKKQDASMEQLSEEELLKQLEEL